MSTRLDTNHPSRYMLRITPITLQETNPVADTPILSYVAQAKALKLDDCISVSERVPISDRFGVKNLTKTLNKLRNRMNQVRARAKEDGFTDFRIDSGTYITDDRTAIILNVTLTCVADIGEDDI